MILLPNPTAAPTVAAASAPEACKIFDSLGFTGRADLPDGQFLGRVTRTALHHHGYSSFSKIEDGVTWIRPPRLGGKARPAIRIRFQWRWDDASGAANSGPRRGDWYLLKVRDGDVTANTAACPQPFD